MADSADLAYVRLLARAFLTTPEGTDEELWVQAALESACTRYSVDLDEQLRLVREARGPIREASS